MSENILQEADRITLGKRNDDYGHPADDFQRTATMWSAVLGCEITPEQVALCMICVKISRLTHDYSRDSVVDIAGYARTLEMIRDRL